MSTPILTDKLSKHYRRNHAVNALDLAVAAGSIYGLIGPNGAGKTTTIKVIMNIIRPSAGRAEILGVDSRRLGPRELARIGYVSENQNLPDEMTVDYFLRYLKPFYPTWDDALCGEMVRQFDLPRDRRLLTRTKAGSTTAFMPCWARKSSTVLAPSPSISTSPWHSLCTAKRRRFRRRAVRRTPVPPAARCRMRFRRPKSHRLPSTRPENTQYPACRLAIARLTRYVQIEVGVGWASARHLGHGRKPRL
jgi:energy-coupling factor transporter ATP-binding protein EcfA2